MLFNSIEFGIFLPIVFAIYWLISNKKVTHQNAFLILMSYFFYGWWDWRFLSLIAFSSSVDYWIGLQLATSQDQNRRKFFLWMSILVNLGFLSFFKYFNFFAESFSDAFTLLGQNMEPSRLQIILPVGISFYTFQTLSYTIDVYKKKLEPTQDIFAFFAFVSFFPQLVAGPIERASNLLPQFLAKRNFNYQQAIDGLRQVLWGLFKKMVIADNCAEYANHVFNNSSEHTGSTLFLAAAAFAFQIYGDFSGYSDIAIGTSRLFGFNLQRNFAFPYFSRDMAEFWRRWHISLSTWFRDYLYIPLGGSRGGTSMKIRNTFIIFLVSGFWHGANWTFIAWGALHAIYFLPLFLFGKNRNHLEIVAKGKKLPSFYDFYQMLFTFILVVLAWVFFRAENIEHALECFSKIFSTSLFDSPWYDGNTKIMLGLILFFIVIEWIGREGEYAIDQLFLSWKKSFRWSFYALLIFMIGLFMSTEESPFIYFQF